MKKLTIKNKDLVPVFAFLQSLNLKGKATRGRTQLLKRVEEKSKEFNEELTEINTLYFKKDEDDEFIVNNGVYEFIDKKKKKEANEKVKELHEEEVEILFGEYSTKLEYLFVALQAIEEEEEQYSNIEFSGQEAYGFNELMEAYERNEEEQDKPVVKKDKKGEVK